MKLRVQLKRELTMHDPRLTEGIQGYTIGNQGEFSKISDRFVLVQFDNGLTFDIAWTNLTILDKKSKPTDKTLDINSILRKIDKESLDYLKTATNVVLYVGPRGGFKYLSYRIGKNTVWNGNKKSSLEEIEIFKYYGIPYEQKLWLN